MGGGLTQENIAEIICVRIVMHYTEQISLTTAPTAEQEWLVMAMTDFMQLCDILMDEIPEDSPWCGRIGELVEKLIANGVTIQKWIPVTERLPDEYVSVLVCIPTEHPLPTVKEAYLANGGWSTKMWIFDKREVTHWMPMPEPPNGGADA
jgi:hypothetical protein